MLVTRLIVMSAVLAAAPMALSQELAPIVAWSFVNAWGGNGDQGLQPFGDLNGDGVMDIRFRKGGCVGTCGLSQPSPVVVLSGATGQVLYAYDDGVFDEGPALHGGVGDFDGDGFADFGKPESLGTAGPGTFTVISGAEGSELHTVEYQGGFRFVPGDLDDDGIADLISVVDFLMPSVFPVRLVAWSGADGAPLYGVGIDTLSPAHQSLLTIPAGDIDGDGVPDLILRETYSDPSSFTRYRFRLISGADGSPLWSVDGFTSALASMAGIGDFDGDGADDVVHSPVAALPPSPSPVGIVRSGHDGRLLLVLHDPEIGLTRTLGSPGDLDGDGIPEVLVSGERTTIFAGADGSALSELKASLSPDGADGPLALASMARLGDATGDGVDDFVGANPDGVFLFNGVSRPIESVSLGTADPLEPGMRRSRVLTASGRLAPESPVTAAVHNGTPGGIGWLVTGSRVALIPLVPGALLVPAPEVVNGFAFDEQGAVMFSGRWPSGVPSGTEIFVQAVDDSGHKPLLLSGGVLLTNALRFTTP